MTQVVSNTSAAMRTTQFLKNCFVSHLHSTVAAPYILPNVAEQNIASNETCSSVEIIRYHWIEDDHLRLNLATSTGSAASLSASIVVCTTHEMQQKAFVVCPSCRWITNHKSHFSQPKVSFLTTKAYSLCDIVHRVITLLN